jgi:hypothetical protein
MAPKAIVGPGMRSPLTILCAIAVTGCGATPAATTTSTERAGHALAALVARSRPIGVGPRFQPPLRERPVTACRRPLGPRDGVHIELFAADRVVLLPAGIGTRGPRRTEAGRVTAARCYGSIVTLDPTGLVLVRRGQHATLGTLFAQWGARLTRRDLASFTGDVALFVNGRRAIGDPRSLALRRHAVIVVEVGPRVAPHRSYTFPIGS